MYLPQVSSFCFLSFAKEAKRLRKDWDRVPQSINSFGGIFRLVSHRNHFQQVKMSISAKFHACFMKCTIITLRDCTISLSRLAKVLKLISLCNLHPRTKELCWCQNYNYSTFLFSFFFIFFCFTSTSKGNIMEIRSA